MHGNHIETDKFLINSQQLGSFRFPLFFARLFVNERHFLCLLFEIVMNCEKINFACSLLWNWKSHSDEGIKSDRLKLAIRANNLWFILASHQIDYYWLISPNMRNPTLQCHYFICSSFTFYWFHVWLFADSVQILV